MNLTTEMQQTVLNILNENYNGRDISRKEFNKIVIRKFRIKKELICLVLEELEKSGEVRLTKHRILLKSYK